MKVELNGKMIEISETATVTVDVGRYRNAFKRRGTFTGLGFGQAVILFNGINIGNGFKARLTVDGKTVARKADPTPHVPTRRVPCRNAIMDAPEAPALAAAN